MTEYTDIALSDLVYHVCFLFVPNNSVQCLAQMLDHWLSQSLTPFPPANNSKKNTIYYTFSTILCLNSFYNLIITKTTRYLNIKSCFVFAWVSFDFRFDHAFIRPWPSHVIVNSLRNRCFESMSECVWIYQQSGGPR